MSSGKPGVKLLAAAKEFQDAAGEHHDAVVAEARIRALLRGVRAQRTALAAGILDQPSAGRRDAVARRRFQRRGADTSEAAGKVWA